MVQAGFAHANYLATQIREEIASSNSQLVNLLTEIQDGHEETQMQLQQANATMQTSTHANTLKLIEKLQNQMAKMQKKLNEKSTTPDGAEAGTGCGRRTREKTPDDECFHRANKDKYCWTHGACSHDSSECKAKAPGHKDTATKDNKQGDSKAFCT